MCELVRYSLSYKDLEEMMIIRGMQPDHSTIWHWVAAYAKLVADKICRKAKRPNSSGRVDEASLKVRCKYVSLYRDVDSDGDTVDFWLSSKRDAAAAERLFKRTLQNAPECPAKVTTDKNAALIPSRLKA